jgi:hypothetical protein
MTLLDAIAAALGTKPGTVTHVDEIHADDCALRDGLPCDCVPHYAERKVQ